ncbi:capsular biosynthesis protein [Staphylococcus croceilyticus]|uniref:Tyrosine-protein phosphatase n=1 Tax=Staphylococcus croceilyticus TaxID=319942 RepID=A0ABY2KES7_9STAP|nr:CpsB/CapC family capsule biosynthesis tyrosine phosphatase [Staphylococcus croceilyticus]PNZ70005.1 capsular biosynthesis protein [Staphylococcus croceilyticus]TGA80423.1 capsular biosynthesis protein [Staphylococcus croceilyticus]
MIDIHNHLLIGVDDGAKSKEDAISLLKQAKEEGITDIIVTPHHLSPQFDNYYNEVQVKLEEILHLDEFRELNINIHPGQEIRISDQILPQLNSGEIIGLNKSKYLLIELPSGNVPHYTGRLFFELQSKGYVPVIAHPERNKEIVSNLDKLFELVNSGALSQLTTASLVGKHGKKIQKVCLEMIKNDLVHFLASDAHDVKNRPFIMKSLFEEKSLKNYKNEIEELIENAQVILQNKDLKKRQPTDDFKRKKLFGLF